ncbi:MAG: glutamate--tRNA ligase family protein [Vicinamibacterales bacterium]
MSAVPSLSLLAAALPPNPLTRFAPSPTGFLHIGHTVNALYVWGLAQALHGRVLIRLEDHDRTRCRDRYERAILEDLEWLGLLHDAVVERTAAGSPRVERQRNAEREYEQAMHRLAAHGLVYACRCSRRTLARTASGDTTIERPYPGTCRRAGLAHEVGLGLRVIVGPSPESFHDLLLGPQHQMPADECGDLLIRDRHGCWTYQFAVVVDDDRQGVDLVVRGADLLASTGRQLHLSRLLGSPRGRSYLHHPIVFGRDGAKLSKSAGDTGIGELREMGWSPGAVLGRAAHACGLLGEPRQLVATRLGELFTNLEP